MKFKYINPDHTQVSVELAPGETFGNLTQPADAQTDLFCTIGMAPGNKEYGLLQEGLASGEIVVEDYAEPPPPIPAWISDRQFFWGLYKNTLITRDQAMAAIKQGTTPPLVEKILSEIKNLGQRDDMEALIMGAKEIYRDRPETNMFGSAVGMSPAQIDDFFRYCYTL